MLSLLRVENLSVIESVSVEFTEGLNVITGETGAGKSVFIGALKLLLGERFSRAMLRDEDKKLVVEGVFTGDFSYLGDEVKEQFGIEDEVIIRREIDSSGKNRVYVNGKLATVLQLREISEGFADIHGQHEHQRLLNPACHIEFIDASVKPETKLNFLEFYEAYKGKKKNLENIRADIAKTLREKDILEFQLNEIESMNINPAADAEIDGRLKMLSHTEKIRETASNALSFLKDGEVNAADLLGNASALTESIAGYGPELAKASETLTEVIYRLNEVNAALEKALDMQEVDPSELDSLMDRKFRLANLMKKYGSSLEDVVAFGASLRERLDNLFMDEDAFSKMDKEVEALLKAASGKASELNLERKKAAQHLSSLVEKTLAELELKNSVFVTEFAEQAELDELGGVKAEFYISTNPGVLPGPLAKVASGGEISRVMLSLKDVFAEADSIDTLVFDEIDTGISGKTARQVAKKLAGIASNKQVIVITHLPVVAAEGERHFHISKGTDHERARTEVKLLEQSEREEVLAMMIAGEKTASSIEQAKELLKGRG
jgi:DNA repair protein RecN (Recombination protein N)